MDKKGIRKITLSILGVLVAIVSTMFLLWLDTKFKTKVYALFGLAIFGLGGGILQVFGALNSQDEESPHAWWTTLLSTLMSAGLVLLTVLLTRSQDYVTKMTSTETKLIVKLIMIFLAGYNILFGAINATVGFGLAVRITRERFKFFEISNNKKATTTISILKRVIAGASFELIGFALIILMLFPLLTGEYSYKIKNEELGRLTTTISYVLNNFTYLFGLAVKLDVREVSTYSVSGVIVPTEIFESFYGKGSIAYSQMDVSLGINYIVYASLLLTLIGSFISMIMVMFRFTAKRLWIRVFFGLVALVGGALSFLYPDIIISSIVPLCDEGAKFSIGFGVKLYSILITTSGVVFALLPIFEVKNRVKRLKIETE